MNQLLYTYVQQLNTIEKFYPQINEQLQGFTSNEDNTMDNFMNLIAYLLKEKSKNATQHESYPQWYAFNLGYYQFYGQFVVECGNKNNDTIIPFIMHNWHFVLDELLIIMRRGADNEDIVLTAVGKIAAMQDILEKYNIQDEPTQMLYRFECLPYSIYKKYGILFASMKQMKTYDINI